MFWFSVLLLLVAAERVAELVLSRRNATWSRTLGGREYGMKHYPFMVALHAGLLVAAPLEVVLADRSFLPVLGTTMLLLVLMSQGLRWWCIATLGRQWNTRVIVVPSLSRVARGPYAILRHPNYVAVVLEGAALPLVHNAWVTAALFSGLNAVLLRVRIRSENRALGSLVSS